MKFFASKTKTVRQFYSKNERYDLEFNQSITNTQFTTLTLFKLKQHCLICIFVPPSFFFGFPLFLAQLLKLPNSLMMMICFCPLSLLSSLLFCWIECYISLSVLVDICTRFHLSSSQVSMILLPAFCICPITNFCMATSMGFILLYQPLYQISCSLLNSLSFSFVYYYLLPLSNFSYFLCLFYISKPYLTILRLLCAYLFDLFSNPQ